MIPSDFTDDSRPLWAFYSAKAREAFGGVNKYELEDGSIVLCTAVCTIEDGEGYLWDDKVRMGRVKRWIGRVERSKLPSMIAWAMFGPDGQITYRYEWTYL